MHSFQAEVMKTFGLNRLLFLLLVISVAGCDRLSDREFKSLWCEVWRDSGSQSVRAPYKQVLEKDYRCWVGGARVGMVNRCAPGKEEEYLKELNAACDALQ